MEQTIAEQANHIKELHQIVGELDTSTKEQIEKFEKTTSKKISVPIAVQVCFFPCNMFPCKYF